MIKIKKILIGIICILMIMPSAVWAANDEPLESGSVIIGSTSVPGCKYGKDVKLTIPLINNEKVDITNVIVAPIQNESSAVYPFTTGKTNVFKSAKSIAKGKQDKESFVFQFTVRTDVETKEYPVKFDITYTKNTGTKDAPAERDVHLVKTIFFQVTGNSEWSPMDTPAVTDAPVNGETTDMLGQDTGSNAMNSGDGSSGEESESKSGTPRVIIDGFRTEPAVVNAGDTFKLFLQVRNTSKKTAISNLELNLQGTSQSEDLSDSASNGSDTEMSSDAFMPVKGSSTLYVDSIGADKTQEISIDLTARADLSQKPYVVSVNMNYEDSNANPFDSASSISIPVKQKARLEVSGVLAEPESIMLDEEGSITFTINNLGRTKLYNVRARAQADSISASDAFVGNIDSGDSGEVELLVTGIQETLDEGEVNIIITYEDQEGKEDTYKMSCTLLVSGEMTEAVDGMMGGFIEGEETSAKGFNIWVLLGIAAVVIVAAIVVIIIVIKRKHKKEEDFADEFFGSDTDE